MKALVLGLLMVLVVLAQATPAMAREAVETPEPIECWVELCGSTGRIGGCDPLGEGSMIPWDVDAVTTNVRVGGTTFYWIETPRWEIVHVEFSEYLKGNTLYFVEARTPTGLTVEEAITKAKAWCASN